MYELKIDQKASVTQPPAMAGGESVDAVQNYLGQGMDMGFEYIRDIGKMN